MTTRLRITDADYQQLRSHLFRSDHDEHAAVLLAGIQDRGGTQTLLTHEVHLLDPDEFPPGERGYRQLAPGVLAQLGNRAADQQLALISCHSHPGADAHVSLSRDDLAGHARVFPHLLDIVYGSPVGGLALGRNSAAGDVWFPNGRRTELDHVDVVGARFMRLVPAAPSSNGSVERRFDRQARLFGAAGQRILRGMTVGVVGLGGGGSMVMEQLAHLGVGSLVAVDYDSVEAHNLSRIVGSAPADVRRGRKKVDVARRLVERIDPTIRFDAVDGDIADPAIAGRLAECDFMFLCTDTISSRLVANAIAHAHFVPMVQIGAKVDLRPNNEIESVYVAVRPVLPGRGCLACAGLIDPIALQQESATLEERAAQNYLGLPEVIDPSVVTLNGVGASVATNLMLMMVVGLAGDEHLRHRLFDARHGAWLALDTQKRDDCVWCGRSSRSRFARGDRADLPIRIGQPARQPRSLFRRLLRKVNRYPEAT